MDQICSVVQDSDGSALFVVLQPLMDLKGHIVFVISKGESERWSRSALECRGHSEAYLSNHTHSELGLRTEMCTAMSTHAPKHVQPPSTPPYAQNTKEPRF